MKKHASEYTYEEITARLAFGDKLKRAAGALSTRLQIEYDELVAEQRKRPEAWASTPPSRQPEAKP